MADLIGGLQLVHTEPLRLSRDETGTNDVSFLVSAGGVLTIAPVGLEVDITGGLVVSDDLTVTDTSTLTGNVGIGTAAIAAARLLLAAGAASYVPLQLTSGTLKTSPADGGIEYDGSAYYGTVGATRRPFYRVGDGLAYTDLTYSGLTTGTVLRATGAAAASFGALDLANASAVTGALPWANVSKSGSSLADLATRSAADLSSGNLAYSRLPTGGGTWANGGALSITGGATTVAGLVSSATVTAATGIGIAAAQKLYWDGVAMTGDTYTYESSANVLDTFVGGTNVLRMQASKINTAAGNQFIFGHTAALDTQPSVTPSVQVIGTDGLTSAGMAFIDFAASAIGPRFAFAHSRGASIGTHTRLNANDQIGGFDFGSSDGTVFQQAAFIRAFASGSQTATGLGSYIGLGTQADGTVTATREVVRITNAGDLALRAASKLILSGLTGTTSYIYEVVSNVVGVNVSGNDTLVVRGTNAQLAGDLLFNDATYDIGKSGATRPRDGFFSRDLLVGGRFACNGAALASAPDYTVTNPTTNRSLDVTGATAAQVAQVLGTVISDLIAIGLYQ